MSFYVSAIAPLRTSVPSEFGGMFDAPVRTISHGSLAAWGCSIGTADVQPTTENLVAHELLVEDIRAIGPALPVRFGTVLADDDAVRRALAERYEALTNDLSRVGDKVEMTLTILGPRNRERTCEDDEGGGGRGARYLRARAVQPGSTATDVRAILGPLAIETRSTETTWPLAFRGSFLLRPEQCDEFRAAFERFRRARPDLRCLLTGPWPPYSFVT